MKPSTTSLGKLSPQLLTSSILFRPGDYIPFPRTIETHQSYAPIHNLLAKWHTTQIHESDAHDVSAPPTTEQDRSNYTQIAKRRLAALKLYRVLLPTEARVYIDALHNAQDDGRDRISTLGETIDRVNARRNLWQYSSLSQLDQVSEKPWSRDIPHKDNQRILPVSSRSPLEDGVTSDIFMSNEYRFETHEQAVTFGHFVKRLVDIHNVSLGVDIYQSTS